MVNINLRNIAFIPLSSITYCPASWKTHCTGEQSCKRDSLSCIHYERTIVTVFGKRVTDLAQITHLYSTGPFAEITASLFTVGFIETIGIYFF